MNDTVRAEQAGGGAVRPERLLMTGLELDHAAEPVWAAAEELGRVRPAVLLRILRAPPPGSALAARVRERIVTAEWIRSLLETDPPELEAVDLLLEEGDDGIARPLLDLLMESDALTVRRKLYSRLVSLGPAIALDVARRCRDKRWYARRNMLALMGEIEPWPPKWSPAEHSADPHPAVRREAFKLMLRDPETRDRGLCGLLEDGDPRALALGLAAATQECPPEAVPFLIDLVHDERVEAAQRVMAVRALGVAEDALAQRTLVELARGAGAIPLVARRRLAPKSPVMLAAIQALSTHEQPSPAAQKMLSRAARSNDPDIRSAALGRVDR
ncbi:MAG: hypothetical protein ACRELC_04800 [Gemmatimonadota bacterium]